jgi:hypothetical protein
VEANAGAGQYIHRRKPRDAETEAVGFEQASKVENTMMTFAPRHSPAASTNEGVEDHDKAQFKFSRQPTPTLPLRQGELP